LLSSDYIPKPNLFEAAKALKYNFGIDIYEELAHLLKDENDRLRIEVEKLNES